MSSGSPTGAKRKWRSVSSSDRALSHLQVSLLRALPVGDRRAFSEWFSWEGKSGSPRRGCVDKGHWSPGHAALMQRLASLNSRKEGGGLVAVDHRGQGRRGEGRGQGRSWTVGVSMGSVNARPAGGSAVWTSPSPGLAEPAL